jgi:hypothetical protein
LPQPRFSCSLKKRSTSSTGERSVPPWFVPRSLRANALADHAFHALLSATVFQRRENRNEHCVSTSPRGRHRTTPPANDQSRLRCLDLPAANPMSTTGNSAAIEPSSDDTSAADGQRVPDLRDQCSIAGGKCSGHRDV